MVVKHFMGVVDTQSELTKKLYDAAAAYYNGGLAVMSDMDYDRELARLQEMERQSGTIYDISPSIRVGADVVTGLERSAHEQEALSLDKVKYKDREELVDWLGTHTGVLSWKMDGLTVVLTYDDGKLTKAVTRGNGSIGSVVTHNARFFKGIPLTIPYDGHLVVRGECTMSQAEFDRVNEEAGGIYENARNLASATIQMLDSNESRKREIVFTAFELVTPAPDEHTPFLHYIGASFDWLEHQGFNVVDHTLVTRDMILNEIEEWKERLPLNPFPTDGLVLTYNNRVHVAALGSTGHHPHGSIAMKWTDETVETTVRDIEWSVGKTGAITPVAIFDTVRLGLGSNVSRASLHNLSIMKHLPKLDGDGTAVCGIGSKATVYLANMIIPQVYSCTDGVITLPQVCPVCGGAVEVKESNGIETLMCVNPACSAKQVKRIATFASKDGMDIGGLSETRISQLVSNGYIRSVADFYTLKDQPEVVAALASEDGWGKRSVEKLLDAIEKSRETTLQRFLYALSIPLVGHDLSKKLNAYFHGSVDELAAFIWSEPDDLALAGIDGIGPVKSQNFCQWCRELLHDEARWHEFQCLVNQHLRFEAPVASSNAQSLSGLTFVITGAVHDYKNRDEFKASVEARGGKVAGSVSKKTNFLVNNDVESTSGKNKKAKDLGIPIISEDEFIAKFGR